MDFVKRRKAENAIYFLVFAVGFTFLGGSLMDLRVRLSEAYVGRRMAFGNKE